MDIGDEDTDTAAGRLHQLHIYYREYPVTGPEGHSYISGGPRATRTSPSLPFNADVVDHIQASVQEVIQHTRAANPKAGPLPPEVEGVYDWCHEHTAHADEAVAERTAALEYRHRLEHAIRAGDTQVIRPHRCPGCGTVGLSWQAPIQRALCLNRHCARRNGGVARTWSLANLAYEAVASKKRLKDCAT